MRLLLYLLTICLLAGALGCDSNDDGAESFLRYLNASPDFDSLDARVSGRVSISGLAFGEVASDTVGSGTRRVEVRRIREGQLLTFPFNVRLEEGQTYTLIVAGRVSDLQPILLEDDLGPPPSGEVSARIVHGASTAGSVDLYLTGPDADLSGETPDFEGARFGQHTGSLTLVPGSHRLRVTAAGTDSVLVDRTLTSEGGARLTVTLVDPADGGEFDLLVNSDLER